MKNYNFLYFTIILFLMHSCSEKKKGVKEKAEKPAVTILIQPFKDINQDTVVKIAEEIKNIYPNVKVLNAIDFPANTYYKERNRYRADSIIKFLNNKTKEGFVVIGLTSKDISATRGKIKDFGIMGLGYRPGKACVASNFRLSKENRDEQFYKIAIHELGHTQGLPHCPEKMCFMRDAEGKNPTNEETDFCKKCKTFLINKNWKFNSI
ncbi:archaemetzincin [Chryseobacterium bernardetii]|uniref:Archaemetzincin n=2 Tax=Chryseobacterium TaxID=59732 RepID=A0A543EMB1_9FLAO|nr:MULTISPECIES: Zn-dependent protease [Chryseobacterium]MDR6369122.1 archaemetzincin [Chryseobacterium vietnamense]MDR6439955.1 archaemetzincin [Chryseobacterium bernardetii]TQM22727.1 archaemetzincin [Chryseobacterium aquifrigidense]